MKNVDKSQLHTCIIKFRTDFCEDVYKAITGMTKVAVESNDFIFERGSEDVDIEDVYKALTTYYDVVVTDLVYDSVTDEVLIFYREV